MKSKIKNYATLIMGLLLLAVSLYLIKTSNDPQGIMRNITLCLYWHWVWLVWTWYGKCDF